jgi:hypothetical protein
MTHQSQGWSSALLLLLAAATAGCASNSGMRRVEAAKWSAIPSGDRAAVEQKQEPAVAQALEEQRKAAAQEAEARESMARPMPPESSPAPVEVAVTPTGDAERDLAAAKAEADYQAAARDHEAALARARSKCDARKRAWQEANLHYRALATTAAARHVEAAQAEYELAKAQSVSDHARGDQPYDVSGYRGQFARRERIWSDARDKAFEARALHDQRLTELTAAKLEYAALRRDAPTPPAVQVPDSDRPGKGKGKGKAKAKAARAGAGKAGPERVTQK